MEVTHIISWTVLLGIAYVVLQTLKVILYLAYLKFKHGDEIHVYYFPIMGIFYAYLSDVKLHKDFMYKEKLRLTQNPRVKVNCLIIRRFLHRTRFSAK